MWKAQIRLWSLGLRQLALPAHVCRHSTAGYACILEGQGSASSRKAVYASSILLRRYWVQLPYLPVKERELKQSKCSTTCWRKVYQVRLVALLLSLQYGI